MADTHSARLHDDAADRTLLSWQRTGMASLAVAGRAEQVGTELDPRLTFANEPTFLAWARTGLPLIGGGLAVAQAVHFGFGGARRRGR